VPCCTPSMQATHHGSQRFVKHFSTLIDSYEHRITPGSDGLIDVYYLNELVKDREVTHQHYQNCQYCIFRAQNDPKACLQERLNCRRLLSAPQTKCLRSPYVINQQLAACLHPSHHQAAVYRNIACNCGGVSFCPQSSHR